uniref:Lipid-binding serum glycoprotein N-terminal domain-containing protein n=1 Tax=Heliothis virescens TaxID=7102 RepID=A0A2A4JDT5_HELVI
MRILILVTLYTLLPFISARNKTVSRKFGDIVINAIVGSLPMKYFPMSEQDEEASLKASDILGLITLAPNIDPFSLKEPHPVGIDLPFLWLKGIAYLKNLKVVGIKGLTVENIEMRLINLRSDLVITIPRIYFESDFNLQATVSFLPVTFRCTLSGNLYNMTITVAAGAKKDYIPPTGEVLQIDSAQLNVNIKDAKFIFTRMTIGGPKEAVTGPITQLFKETLRTRESVYDSMLKTALKLVNKELAKISIDAFTG